MTARCEPPPEWRDKDGWHWVQVLDCIPMLNRWVWGDFERVGFWRDKLFPTTRYIAPATPHAEVEALRAEVAHWQGIAGLAANDIVVLKARVAELERYGHEFRQWTERNGFTDPENMLVCAEWHNLRAALERKL